MFQILVVEDNKNLLMLMKTRLVQAGYRVLQAENGHAALEIIEEKHIDLIVCDIMMPQMDGLNY